MPEPHNFVLLTYDSCRYDVLEAAHTPVLDGVAMPVLADAPANFTFASHQAFFVGMMPNTRENISYYNRFRKQLLALNDVGEGRVVKNSLVRITSDWNLVKGFRDIGFQTVGAGAMNWFRQKSLTEGFSNFLFTGTDADQQIRFLKETIDSSEPFFGFINFGETHAPYTYRGKKGRCPVDVRARRMQWPPKVDDEPVGAASPAFQHQVEAAEFLDGRLAALIDFLPEDTVVVLTSDHGECFGEDGFWGHGVNHPKVWEVPLCIFRPHGGPLPTGD